MRASQKTETGRIVDPDPERGGRSSRLWRAFAFAAVLHAGILSYGYPRIVQLLKTTHAVEEKAQEGRRTNAPPTLRDLESIISRMEASDRFAFPSDDSALFTSLTPEDIPQQQNRASEKGRQDAADAATRQDRRTGQGAQKDRQNTDEPKPLKLEPDPVRTSDGDLSGPFSSGVPITNILANGAQNNNASKYGTEPVTLAEIKAAKEAFIADLKADMLDDPAGQVRLNHMQFISFFVRSWYYDHAISMLERGKAPLARPDDLYARFDRIMAFAKETIRPEHTALQRDLIFHGTMFRFLKGYERDTSDIRSALIDGVVNCYSATMLATSGYTQLDPNVLINVYSKHIQSASYFGGLPVVIENTTPGNPLYRYDRGLVVKPEKLVSDYLVNKSNVPLSDLPEEVRTWYTYTLPPFGKNKPPAGFMPFLEKPPVSDTVVIQPPQTKPLFPSLPWQITASGPGACNGPSCKGRKVPTSNSSIAVPKKTEPTNAEKIKEVVERVHRQLELPTIISTPAGDRPSEDAAWLYLQQKSSNEINWRLSTLLRDWKMIDEHIESQFGPTPFEALGVYDRRQPPKPFKIIPENRPVLPASVRDADPSVQGIGLIEDLGADNPGSGPELMLIRFPRGNLGEIGQSILDNRLLVVGTSFKDQVKGLYLRNTAVVRAKAFGGFNVDLVALRDSRMAALGEIMRGERVQDFGALYSTHQGYSLDPLLSLKEMEASRGRKGLAVSAIEDLISFSGENEAVDAVIGYLGRKDLELDRMRYGAIIMSLRSRLLEGRGHLDGKLLGMLRDTERPISLRAAAAQTLHLAGSTDPRISDTLESYLRASPDIQREEVKLLVNTGLKKERAVAVIRQRFGNILHEMGEKAHLQTDSAKEPEPYKIDKNSAVRLVESFESLVAIGHLNHIDWLIRPLFLIEEPGTSVVPKFDDKGRMTNYEVRFQFAVPIADTVRLLRGHLGLIMNKPPPLSFKIAGDETNTRIFSPQFLGKSIYMIALENPDNLFDRSIAMQGLIKALDSHSLSRSERSAFNNVLWGRGAYDPIFNRNDIVPSVTMLYPILEQEPNSNLIPQRVSVALSFARLGYKNYARTILGNDISKNLISSLRYEFCPEGQPPFCGGITQDSPGLLFSIAGVNALSKLVSANDEIQYLKDYMCYSASPYSPMAWLLPFPKDPFIKSIEMHDDALTVTLWSVLRSEADYLALDDMIRKRADDLSILALYLKICENKLSQDPVALRLIRALEPQHVFQEQGGKYNSALWPYQRRLTKGSIAALVRIMQLEPFAEPGVAATTILAAKGYLAIGPDGQVIFQDPPKPYRPLIGSGNNQGYSEQKKVGADRIKQDDAVRIGIINAGRSGGLEPDAPTILRPPQTKPIQPKKPQKPKKE